MHSRAAAHAVKAEGKPNPLMELIADDPVFAAIRDRLPDLMQPSRFVGRCAEQVDAFVAQEVAPRLDGVDLEGMAGDLRV